jgi:hypothetical protein
MSIKDVMDNSTCDNCVEFLNKHIISFQSNFKETLLEFDEITYSYIFSFKGKAKLNIIDHKLNNIVDFLVSAKLSFNLNKKVEIKQINSNDSLDELADFIQIMELIIKIN